VSPASDPPVRYQVVYSERVRTELKQLIARAAARGLSQAVLQAIKEIDRRLQVYPQFGEPRRDLETKGESVWSGTVPPLVVEYVLDEERRLVFVVDPFTTLPHMGL
jgi:hypothetical protein